MKLLIDARPLQNGHRTRGVGTLLQNLLPALGLRTEPSDSVALITMEGREVPPLFNHEQSIKTFRLERPNRFNWIADHLFLPGLARRSGAEVFFATDFNSYLIPTGGVRVVSMAYDLIPFIFPESMAAQPLPVKVGWRINFPKLVKSNAIIAISEATKQDLIRLFKIDPERITVIYPGINHTLFNVSYAQDRSRQKEVLARYGIAGNFFLYVGDSEWRKNLQRCLEAIVEIDPEIKLVLVGKRALNDSTLLGWIDSLGLRQRVIMTGFVPDVELPLLYGAADAFLFPSIYEGFGLPVAEAMACGCPVITSSVSSMPEVAGHAGILVDPSSVAGIHCAMSKILTDTALRKQLQQAGPIQAQKFNWSQTAVATMALLRKAAA